jgi:hypothetical protein
MTHNPSPVNVTTSNPVVIGAIVAVALLATAAALFIAGDTSLQRLGLLFALLGTATTGLLASLRSDHAAQQTSVTSDIATALNGDFEARVAAAVADALAARAANAPSDRASDQASA